MTIIAIESISEKQKQNIPRAVSEEQEIGREFRETSPRKSDRSWREANSSARRSLPP